MINFHASLGVESRSTRRRVLYINPNSSRSLTDGIIHSLRSRAPPGVTIDFYTAPSDAPSSIDGFMDGILSASSILRDWKTKENGPALIRQCCDQYDVIIVACFSDHPLVAALRELFGTTTNAPHVLGIMQASVSYAVQTSSSFGIVTTGTQWEAAFDEYVRQAGIARSRYAGTLGTGFSAGGLNVQGEAAIDAMARAVSQLAKRGATSVVLGCAGMNSLKCELQQKLAEQSLEIEIIDPVTVAVESSAMISRTKVKVESTITRILKHPIGERNT